MVSKNRLEQNEGGLAEAVGGDGEWHKQWILCDKPESGGFTPSRPHSPSPPA